MFLGGLVETEETEPMAGMGLQEALGQTPVKFLGAQMVVLAVMVETEEPGLAVEMVATEEQLKLPCMKMTWICST
jgi:hypothetical protein